MRWIRCWDWALARQLSDKAVSYRDPDPDSKGTDPQKSDHSQGAVRRRRDPRGPFTVDTFKMECLKNGEPLNFTARVPCSDSDGASGTGTQKEQYTQVWR